MSPSIGRRHQQHTRTGTPSTRNNAHAIGSIRPTVLLLARLLPLASAAPLSLLSHTLEDDVDAPKDPSDPNLYLYLGVAVALVLLGGVFAGLTIALMGQDETYLQVIATSGEGSEKRHASKVLGLLKKGKHWVLVTLLLSNVITNETLPIVLDRSLGGGWPAVLSSTVLIVIFGEIVPQSICVRYGLSIGAYCASLVWVLMCIMMPVAWPTAKLLDWLLGEDHGTMYKKAGLKTLVTLHRTLGSSAGEQLMEDEVTIINSVLDLKEKPVGDIMTPMQDVFTMSADTVLDERMMDTILSQGYSRIPIYAPDNNRNFIGMLLVKILITYDPEDGKRVRDFALATLPETAPYTSCLDIINFFQEGKSHMVLVSDFPGQDKGALGVVTLEDVIEELIGEEIIDESDVFVDVHKAIRRMAPAPRQKFRHGSLEPRQEVEEAKEYDEDEPLIRKDTSTSRKSSQINGVPAATFLMRRKSSTASDDPAAKSRPVPVRSNTAEVREHLKHLGPSNVASKPRPTKFTSVKIKPGLDTIPQGQAAQATSTGTDAASSPTITKPRSRSLDDQPPPPSSTLSANIPPTQTDEGEGLLRSAGRDASGGAAALRAGYGTIGSPDQSSRARPMSADQMSPGEASRVAEQKAVSPQLSPRQNGQDTTSDSPVAPQRSDTLQVPSGGKMVIGDDRSADDIDNDTLGEMEGPSRERSKSRRAARSGSITETTVEMGGVKKTVLETTSSSEEGEEEGKGSGGEHSPVEGGKEEGDEGSQAAEGGVGGDGGEAAEESAADGAGAGKKKKGKKRGKRKKDGKGS